MKRILIMYFSGAGATKKVAELMRERLSEHSVKLFPLENGVFFNATDYDALIIGTPVYHASPARIVMDYFKRMPALAAPMPAFIYNTRGLYPCNTNRILSKLLASKNIKTILDSGYRSPASDVTLLLPSMRQLFEFERGLDRKIASDCAEFIYLLENGAKAYIPRFRFSGILNAPNKLAGRSIKPEVYLHRDRCIKCGKCIHDCPHNAFVLDGSGYPSFMKSKCENCYRCVHHCPEKALSLSKRRKVKKVVRYH